MAETLVKVLMTRDKISREEAEDLIQQAVEDLKERLDEGDDLESCYDICEEWFGLEPDYLEELIYLASMG